MMAMRSHRGHPIAADARTAPAAATAASLAVEAAAN